MQSQHVHGRFNELKGRHGKAPMDFEYSTSFSSERPPLPHFLKPSNPPADLIGPHQVPDSPFMGPRFNTVQDSPSKTRANHPLFLFSESPTSWPKRDDAIATFGGRAANAPMLWSNYDTPPFLQNLTSSPASSVKENDVVSMNSVGSDTPPFLYIVPPSPTSSVNENDVVSMNSVGSDTSHELVEIDEHVEQPDEAPHRSFASLLAVVVGTESAELAFSTVESLVMSANAECRSSLSNLVDEEAQRGLDVLQCVSCLALSHAVLYLIRQRVKYLDEQWPEDLSLRRRAIYLLLKLASTSRKFPYSFFVDGVDIGTSRDPVAQGGFADVFRGTYRGQAVALKRPRTNAAANTDYHRVKTKASIPCR
jgi:hypothetical protein